MAQTYFTEYKTLPDESYSVKVDAETTRYITIKKYEIRKRPYLGPTGKEKQWITDLWEKEGFLNG